MSDGQAQRAIARFARWATTRGCHIECPNKESEKEYLAICDEFIDALGGIDGVCDAIAALKEEE